MAKFKDHKITASQLLGTIPEALLSHLSATTSVDYYTKVLHGRKMFYLLMYGMLENDRLSQRSLEDTFNDPIFKTLFDLDADESVRRSSISDRLSRIDADYFRQIYECLYDQFVGCYSGTERQHYNLIRVDSSMVSEATTKLSAGIDNKSGKKAIKYSMAFDGVLPCDSTLFTDAQYASEDLALPEVVRNHVMQERDHRNVYLIDRGLMSARNMKAFEEESITFIARTKENRKYVELESMPIDEADMGESVLLKDSKVYLYTKEPILGERGKTYRKSTLVEVPFRLIIIQKKTDDKQQYWFITNEFSMPAKEITEAYRRRWDIEVFFRFIKQELNFSHLVSVNKNGLQVMLYMTLIVAILVLIYKRANNIGYKTAKRRFAIELRDLAIAMIVIQCGGNPDIYFKT